jgi:hypothetical protein
MKFGYEKDDKLGPVMASLMLFDGGPKMCLCIKTEDPNRFIWMYEDGDITLQSLPLKPQGKDVVKNFYRGDTLTLTF